MGRPGRLEDLLAFAEEARGSCGGITIPEGVGAARLSLHVAGLGLRAVARAKIEYMAAVLGILPRFRI